MPEIPVVPALWRFPAQPPSVGRARHALAEWLPKDVPHGVRGDLALLASELVTNAVRYGAGSEELVELVVWPADGHYWVAVSDPGDGRPVVRRPPDVERESGRGLLLVDALAAAWGVRPRPYRRKAVVAGLALP